MKYSEKFHLFLTTIFFSLGFASVTGAAHADQSPPPKSAFGKLDAKPLQGSKPAAEQVLGAPAANPSAGAQGETEHQVIKANGEASPTAPLTPAIPADSSKALKDIDFKTGNWMEFRKKDAAGQIVSVCGAMNHENSPFRIMFRAAKNNSLAVDTLDTTWALPPDITGETTFSVGNFRTTFTMKQKNQMTLEANVTPQQLSKLLDALETEKKVIVIFGTGHRHTVSLNGAKEVLGRFRDCSLSHGFADIGGY